MQAKISLCSLLATFLAVDVIATPTGVVARDIGSSRSPDGAITPFEKVATAIGTTKSRPNGLVITPKDGDVPAVSTSVEARDLEDLEKRTPGCIYITMGSGFTGTAAYVCLSGSGGCWNFVNSWRYSIGSFGPDPGTTCQIFTGTVCGSGGSPAFGYPGYGNLGLWQNNVGSFRCWW